MSATGMFLIDTEDIGEAEAGLCANFGDVSIDVASDAAHTRTRVRRHELGALTLDEAEFTYSMSFTMEPSDKIMLCRVRSGTMHERRPHGDATVYGPGDIAIFGAVEGARFGGAVHAARYDLFVVDRHALTDAAGTADHPVRLLGGNPLSTSANRLMLDTVEYVRHGVMTNARAGTDPLLPGVLTNCLAAALVSSFPVDMPDARTRSLPPATEVLVRLAITYIDEHAHIAITPADIAAAAHLTPQALQMMFVQHQGCTPMQYVRRVRLDHAHRELVAADPATTSVVDVAKRWGFTSVSRFAVSYRLAYGRSPAATLRASSFRRPH
jgi:AraC-like DNA-binding protein